MLLCASGKRSLNESSRSCLPNKMPPPVSNRGTCSPWIGNAVAREVNTNAAAAAFKPPLTNLYFTQGQWSNISYVVSHLVVAVVGLSAHPHPSPRLLLHLSAPGPHVLPDRAHGKVCLCPLLLCYFCLSCLLPLSRFFLTPRRLHLFHLRLGGGGSAARTIQIDHL